MHKRILLRHKKYLREILRKRSSSVSKPKVSSEAIVWQDSEFEFRPGAVVEGFSVKRVANIPEFSLTAVELKHQKSGAQYMHLARDDSNNAFCVSFRTTPTDSTGLPHILEHCSLCGSKNFPCRDPFFKMLNRSLATFMNAMTGPDYTIYPFSTQNSTDYANLMSVYLDAAFHPNLRELDFIQEGWRLEHAEVENPNSPIILKGVVFNEMKGSLSENQNLFLYSILNNLLPSHTYGVISGGDPLAIPKLTYSDFKEFHKKYYHPSNSRFYSYGNFPLLDHLKFINKNYLSHYRDADYSSVSEVLSEPRWDKERRIHVNCRNDPLAPNPAKQSSIAVANICTDIRNVSQTFVLNVLSELLVRGPNSAFYKSLIEPNIGGGFSAVTGYESHTKDTFFTVGLQGVDPQDFDKVIDIYNKTIDTVIDEGFDENNINAILHNIELAIKHQSSDFGLSVLYQIAPIWNHGGDVIQTLNVNHQVEKLKRALADNPLYLQDRVQEYFKENNHKLIVTMSPDDEYEHKLQKAENTILKEKLDSMSSTDKENIFNQGLQLAKDQDVKQDLSCLPTLRISDLNQDVERTFLDGLLMQSVPVQVCTAPTNGVIYFKGILNVNILSNTAKDLLPLFCYILTKMGTTKYDYRQLDQLIQLKTGGLMLSTHLAQNIFDTNSFEQGILFSSFCLSKNVKAMFSIWENIFNNIDLSLEKRFNTLVQVHASSLINGINDSGQHYAMSSSGSFVSATARMKERFGGLTYVKNIKKLSMNSDLTDVLDLMNKIAKAVLLKKNMRASLNIYPGSEDKILPEVDSFLSKLGGNFESPFIVSSGETIPIKTTAVHHVFNQPVNHTAMSIPTVEYTHKDHAALKVLARLLTLKYLFPRIREKGGAYGCGASILSDGVFNFFSYRDPKVSETFDIFNDSEAWIKKGDFSDHDVDEAKLGVFQSIDAPIPPGVRGARNFLYGISDDILQNQRLEIMKLTMDDIIRASSHLNSKSQGRALLGPKNEEILRRTSENWRTEMADSF